MNRPSWLLSRRTMLRGAGVALALPFMEAMIPRPLYGSDSKVIPRKGPPVRFGVLLFPNGINQHHWTPKEVGPLTTDLPLQLKPMAKVIGEVNVLSGLTNRTTAGGDGHLHKDPSFLTCLRVTDTDGADLNAGGTSIDQVLAQQVGSSTKLPSIELGIEPTLKGVISTGLTRLYGNHIAWSSPTTPLACEINPRQAFDRLFRDGTTIIKETPKNLEPTELTPLDDKSVLDAVIAESQSLKTRLGIADQRKLDEYLTSVRDVEKRISQEIKRTTSKDQRRVDPNATKAVQALQGAVRTTPHGIPQGQDHSPHVRLMLDIMTLAFWTDSTRIGTFMFGTSTSNRNFSFLDGVKGVHHEITHHDDDPEKLASFTKIVTWHVEQFAYMVDRMANIKEGSGTLLDNTMILFGSSIRDGNSHSVRDLPLVLAGKGGGTIKPGRHIKIAEGTPLANLYIEMAMRMGLKLDSFADSNGGIGELAR